MYAKKWTSLIVILLTLAMLLAACDASETATPSTEMESTATPAGGEATQAPSDEEAATPAGEEEAVTVDLWFHSGRGAERDALREILNNFAEQHPNITVDAVELPVPVLIIFLLFQKWFVQSVASQGVKG